MAHKTARSLQKGKQQGEGTELQGGILLQCLWAAAGQGAPSPRAEIAKAASGGDTPARLGNLPNVRRSRRSPTAAPPGRRTPRRAPGGARTFLRLLPGGGPSPSAPPGTYLVATAPPHGPRAMESRTGRRLTNGRCPHAPRPPPPPTGPARAAGQRAGTPVPTITLRPGGARLRRRAPHLAARPSGARSPLPPQARPGRRDPSRFTRAKSRLSPSLPPDVTSSLLPAALRGRHFRKQDVGALGWVSVARPPGRPAGGAVGMGRGRAEWRCGACGRGAPGPRPRGQVGRAVALRDWNWPSPISCGRAGTPGWCGGGGARFVRFCGGASFGGLLEALETGRPAEAGPRERPVCAALREGILSVRTVNGVDGGCCYSVCCFFAFRPVLSRPSCPPRSPRRFEFFSFSSEKADPLVDITGSESQQLGCHTWL